jgi:hypothetical protein
MIAIADTLGRATVPHQHPPLPGRRRIPALQYGDTGSVRSISAVQLGNTGTTTTCVRYVDNGYYMYNRSYPGQGAINITF